MRKEEEKSALITFAFIVGIPLALLILNYVWVTGALIFLSLIGLAWVTISIIGIITDKEDFKRMWREYVKFIRKIKQKLSL